MRYIIALLAVLAALLVSSPSHAGEARTVRLETPKRHVAVTKIVRVKHAGPNLRVRFNTRSLWRVAPCKHEDSNNCYWNARKRGNGQGSSFVVIRGQYFSLTQ